MWQIWEMPEKSIAVDACSKLVESATRSCQPLISVPPETPHPNWDAIAVSLTSQSNAFSWGALLLGFVAIVAGFAWGKIVAVTAEKEAREAAREAAQACADVHIKKWLEEVAPPLIKREAVEFLRTFRGESTISDNDLASLVNAVGNDGKEGDDGK